MKRVLSILLICILTVSLCACSTSPTAVRVNGTAVDASEAAFYLHYNRDAGDLADIKAAALEQIATAELVRQKCKDLKLSLSKEQKDTLKQEKDTLIDQLGGMAAYLDYLESAYLTDRCYDKSQENGLYYQLLYNYMLEKNKDVFTSEYLRQFFASDYLAIQYIAISRLDNDGNPLSETEDQAQKDKAEAALSAMLSDNADYSAIIEEYNEDPEMIGLTEPLVLSRAAVKEDYPFLLPAFQLAAGEFDGIYTTDDGYYILIRSAVSANYYAEHQEDIYHTAVNTAFQQAMEYWMKTCKITTTKVFDKMNLDNLAEYVK
jgi:hypothetical protein